MAFDKINKKRSGESGFSLVELMIVVGIIGILSTMIQTNLLPKVRRSLAMAQLQTIARSLIAVRQIDGKTLGEINNGNFESYIGCQSTQASTCTKMDAAMQSWGFNGAKKTPWGGYYWVDENNGEYGPADLCRMDSIGFYDGDRKVNVIIDIPALGCENSTWSNW